jgi:predicted RecB family endonuclease
MEIGMVEKTGINFRISISHIEKLKKIAREKAYKEDVEVSYIDLIKEAYEEKYSLEVDNG